MKALSKALAAAAVAGTVGGCVAPSQTTPDLFLRCALNSATDVTGQDRGHVISEDLVRSGNGVLEIARVGNTVVATGGTAGQNAAAVTRTNACMLRP